MGALLNIFKIPELRGKLLFTLAFLAIYRIGFSIPLPFVNQATLHRGMGGGDGLDNLFNFVSMFSGGDLSNATVFGLGIMPYISAGIIMQLLAFVVPSLHRLMKEEGQIGQKIINNYTRLLTVFICMIQAGFYLNFLRLYGSQSSGALMGFPEVYAGGGWWYFLTLILCMVVGTMFLMWIGEQIDEYGIGNGVSLIIMAGIVSRLPAAILQLLFEQTSGGWVFKRSVLTLGGSGQDMSFERVLALVLLFLVVVLAAVLMSKAQRRIPMQSAKFVRGSRVFGGGNRNFLPIKINQANVMPVIFASSLMLVPYMLFLGLGNTFKTGWLYQLADAFQRQGWIYMVAEVILIYVFSYIWLGVTFDTREISEQFKRTGLFIPGFRPGPRTQEYLDRVVSRVNYVGAGFLALIAILPSLVSSFMQVRPEVAQFFGGTGLLIVVSVVLDLVQRINSHLVMREYKGLTED
jgi:preprotein translocase subunit SecY